MTATAEGIPHHAGLEAGSPRQHTLLRAGFFGDAPLASDAGHGSAGDDVPPSRGGIKEGVLFIDRRASRGGRMDRGVDTLPWPSRMLDTSPVDSLLGESTTPENSRSSRFSLIFH